MMARVSAVLIFLVGLLLLESQGGYGVIKHARGQVSCGVGVRVGVFTGCNTLASATYVGPGDVVSGATMWAGLRAYNLATAGTKAVRIVRASDSAQQDINSLANGKLDTATAATFCNATTCKVVTLYDQTVGGNCTGSCDLTMAADANRPVFTFSCLGSLPCMTSSGGSINLTSGAAVSVGSRSVPFSLVGAAIRTSGTTYSAIFRVGQGLFYHTANNLNCFDGADNDITANDNTWHAAMMVLNSAGTNNRCVSDGSGTNFANTGNPTNQMFIFADPGNPLTGSIVEVGMWNLDLTASVLSMNSNIHTYWGF